VTSEFAAVTLPPVWARAVSTGLPQSEDAELALPWQRWHIAWENELNVFTPLIFAFYLETNLNHLMPFN
jgi:hypothetical protein